MTARRVVCLSVICTTCLAAASLASCSGDSDIDTGFVEVTTGAGGGGGEGGRGEAGASSSSSGQGSGSTGTGEAGGAGGEGGEGGAGGVGGSGSGGAGGGGGEACPDTGNGEPNDTEATATALMNVSDCDNESTMMVAGVLAGPDDVDWYSFEGTDVGGCTVDAERVLASAEKTQLCKYVQCVSGTAEFTCPAGSTPDVTPTGDPGCCALQGFTIEPDCDGIDDSATVLIRLNSPDGLACIPYTLKVHY